MPGIDKAEGTTVIAVVGLTEGLVVLGMMVGETDGTLLAVGTADGTMLGAAVDAAEGSVVGAVVGAAEGTMLGAVLGDADGGLMNSRTDVP